MAEVWLIGTDGAQIQGTRAERDISKPMSFPGVRGTVARVGLNTPLGEMTCVVGPTPVRVDDGETFVFPGFVLD